MSQGSRARWRKANRGKFKNRLALLIIEAKSKPCADCGESYPYYVMDFDHVRGEKLFNIGDRTVRSAGQIRAEIDKCDVVCANCHRERTHRRG